MGRRPQRPAEERELWVTLYYGGLTIEEIAERADVGKQVVHHALKGEGWSSAPVGGARVTSTACVSRSRSLSVRPFSPCALAASR
ncbi:MAG: hypothetical protein IPG34_19945 [Rhodocyclaceae bacterium]|nr:hypothetical protein [Rhodocyclaceae bacterium]